MIDQGVTNQVEGIGNENLDEITRMILDLKELKQELGKLVVSLATQAESKGNSLEGLKEDDEELYSQSLKGKRQQLYAQ